MVVAQVLCLGGTWVVVLPDNQKRTNLVELALRMLQGQGHLEI
jgi:hypothetical protein